MLLKNENRPTGKTNDILLVFFNETTQHPVFQEGKRTNNRTQYLLYVLCSPSVPIYPSNHQNNKVLYGGQDIDNFRPHSYKYKNL